MGLEERNFFSDRAVQDDPYPYFAALRELSPIWQEPHYGVFMVTGYDAARAVYADSANFSSCNVVSGPFKKFSVPLEGDDVSDIIERHRDELPFSDQLPSFDPPKHSAHRGLLTKLLTPRRMRENEDFMWRLADSQLAEVIQAGESEFIHGFAEAIHAVRRRRARRRAGSRPRLVPQAPAAPPTQLEQKPLEFLYGQFSSYIEDRRSTPRADIMTAMATAKFPDGSVPEVHDVALLAANLFAGGQETTVRLLSFALRLIAERPDLQAFLRSDREKIPGFIEETLRYESPLRSQFRMARRNINVAGVDIPAGSNLLLLPGAANRDPNAFPNPDFFDPERKDARNHVTFGHGAHLCLGAHLARAEGRVTINRLLDLTTDIMISERAHGPANDRHYDYLPTFFLRGLRSLTVTYAS